MPASITSLLFLWLAWLPSGVTAEPRATVGVEPTPSRFAAASLALETHVAIQARPLGQDCSWIISEADTQEEETGDGEDDGIVATSHWSSLRVETTSLALTSWFVRVVIPSPTRSTILRC